VSSISFSINHTIETGRHIHIYMYAMLWDAGVRIMVKAFQKAAIPASAVWI
jgi:hypothetical protein